MLPPQVVPGTDLKIPQVAHEGELEKLVEEFPGKHPFGVAHPSQIHSTRHFKPSAYSRESILTTENRLFRGSGNHTHILFFVRSRLHIKIVSGD